MESCAIYWLTSVKLICVMASDRRRRKLCYPFYFVSGILVHDIYLTYTFYTQLEERKHILIEKYGKKQKVEYVKDGYEILFSPFYIIYIIKSIENIVLQIVYDKLYFMRENMLLLS